MPVHRVLVRRNLLLKLQKTKKPRDGAFLFFGVMRAMMVR